MQEQRVVAMDNRYDQAIARLSAALTESDADTINNRCRRLRMSVTGEQQQINITVNILNGNDGNGISVRRWDNNTVKILKEFLKQHFGSNVFWQQVQLVKEEDDAILAQDGDTLAECGIHDGSTLYATREPLSVEQIKDILEEEELYSVSDYSCVQIAEYLIRHDQESLLNNMCETGDITNEGFLPMHFAIKENKPKCLEILLNHPEINVNATDEFKNTPLHLAVNKNSLECVNALLKKRAVANMKNYKDMTPLHRAAYNGFLNCVKALLDNEANPNTQGIGGRTPLHLAAMSGRIECLMVLLDKGADANMQDNANLTPAHCAVQGNHPKCLEYLKNAGANMELCNAYERTPLQMAERLKRAECCLLLQSGQ